MQQKERKTGGVSLKIFSGLTFIRVSALCQATYQLHFKQITAKSHCCPGCNRGIYFQYPPHCSLGLVPENDAVVPLHISMRSADEPN